MDGCLQIIPGSQSIGTPQKDQQTVNKRCRKFTNKLKSNTITLKAKAGESYLLNPLMIHGSLPNKSNRGRRAANVVYMPLNTAIIGYDPLTETDKTRSLKMGRSIFSYSSRSISMPHIRVEPGVRKAVGREILYG